MRFGTWIRAHRLRQGLSMDRLCQQVNISKAHLSLIENSQKAPPKDELVRQLGQALGIDEHELLLRSHRERYPDDVLELRRLVGEMREALEKARMMAQIPGAPRADGRDSNSAPDWKALVQTLEQGAKGIERLLPQDSGAADGLISEIDTLRAEERDFVIHVAREVKSLRPRRGPQNPDGD